MGESSGWDLRVRLPAPPAAVASFEKGNSAHDIDITQDGSGSHGARIDLSGYSYDFDLTQNSGTGQHYTVEGTCGQSGGCTLSTTQN